MRYFLILAMFFALAQAKQARVDISISTPNVFIDSHYYKKRLQNHHKDHYRNKVITSVAISQVIKTGHSTTALTLDGKSFLENSGEF
ncbi:MAG: hypothetical protein SPI08_06010 [Campylobacter sp.]|nr:hypothetical protein [Campylobacter sp.]